MYDTEKDNRLIDDMENIRKKNNTNWMDLVRLAYKLDPASTKIIIRQIVDNDKKIASVLEEIAEE